LFDKQNKKKKKPTEIKGNKVNCPKLMARCDTLDQGTNVFMQWLNSQDKDYSSSNYNNPITLEEFVSNKYSILYDSNIGHDIIVETYEGVPRCRYRNTDDCGHVGFTICLEQKYDTDGTIID
jgi:hypothetical protein